MTPTDPARPRSAERPREARGSAPPTIGPRSEPDVPIKVVGKVARILQVFGQEGAELPLRQIALATGLELSSASRLVTSLARVGLLRYDPIQRLYSPGLLVLELSRIVLNRFSFRELAHRELISLSMKTGWECYLAVVDELDDRFVICIDAVSTRNPEASMIGERRPMHSTATGKLLMAYGATPFDEEQLEARTAFTKTELRELARELEDARRNGFAIGMQEEQLDYYSAAAPIFDRDGTILAGFAIGVIHPGGAPDMEPLVTAAVDKARGISSAVRLADAGSSIRLLNT